MSERKNRFHEHFSVDLHGQQPSQLLKQFNASNIKEMMKNATQIHSSLRELENEAHHYLGEAAIAGCHKIAKSQSKLPEECAFALHAYTTHECFADVNKRLRAGQDLDLYHNLCICMVKGLALLPEYNGKVYRGIGSVQADHVCEYTM